jgi:hypothetical protein
MKKYLIALVALAFTATSCEDFLAKENPNAYDAAYYFKDEASLEIYSNGLHRNFETAIIDFINGDRFSDAMNWDGELLFYTTRYTQKDNASWNWTKLRNTNYFLDNVRKAEAKEEILNHYEGVGRFFRAMFYMDQLETYGRAPWYDHAIETSNKEDVTSLYKDCDARSFIAEKIFEDLDYASKNCLGTAEYRNRASFVNKYVALAMKARFCLFEGTYRKYHTVDPSTNQAWTATEKSQGTKYLQECAAACEEIMNSNIYALSNDYRQMFISADGAGTYSKEFIWARDYNTSLAVNNQSYSINDYMINAQHAQYSFNRDFVMTYLKTDGTPFTSGFAGEDYYKVPFADEFVGRDRRLRETIRYPGFTRADGKLWGADLVYAKTGYQPNKWLTHEINDAINGATQTDVPLIRYAEVLLTYAEAMAEQGKCTEDVWNKSVKLVRERAGVKSIYPTTADPYLVKYFLGEVTNPVILEIRRERGCEFTMEDLRQKDDHRWHMGELLVKTKTGMWVCNEANALSQTRDVELDLNGDGKAENLVSAKLSEKKGFLVLAVNAAGITTSTGKPNSGAGHVLSNGTYGYILTSTSLVAGYKWENKKYVYPIPAVSVTLNEKLTQNYGW